MAWPPDDYPIPADKAPGPPVSNVEHPDHHNALATAINDTVEQVLTIPTFTTGTVAPSSPAVGDVWFDTTP